MPRYRHNIAMMIDAPDIIAWAIKGNAFGDDRKTLLKVAGSIWCGLPREALHVLLACDAEHRNEGSGVIFDYDPIETRRASCAKPRVERAPPKRECARFTRKAPTTKSLARKEMT